MTQYFSRKSCCVVICIAANLVSHCAAAGGIMLGGTRLVYPASAKQITIPVRNTSRAASFLVQSWVENADGAKSTDFLVTPPLYVSGPGDENTLRLIYTGNVPRTDRETLYYFNSKAIPSVEKKKAERENMLLLAAVTRIKLFVRPEKLNIKVNDAPEKLKFHREGSGVSIENPTPYYISLAAIKIGKESLPDTMVAPYATKNINFNIHSEVNVSYRTINDYGAVTPEINTRID